jgi:hypothetical protein
MILIRTSFVISTVALVALGLSSCGGGGDGPPAAPVFDSGQGGSGGSGGSGGGTSDYSCAEFCEVVEAVNCPGDTDCIAKCEAEVAEADPCGAERLASFECIAGLTMACNPGGFAYPDIVQVFNDCLSESVAEARCSICLPDEDDDACDTCSNENCCDEQKAVANDPSFEGHLKCVFNCNSDETCEANCDQTYPSVVSKKDAGVACLQANCASATCPPP